MKHIISLKQALLIGGFGALLATGLSGCGEQNSSNSAQNIPVKNGATIFIEKDANGYKIIEELPSAQTRVFVREEIDGVMQERQLTQNEIDALLAEENAKIDAGQSGLTNTSLSSGGMSLGGAILASAAGAILGSWIGNKLFNSPGYQAQRQTAYKSPSAYQRSVNSFQNTRTGASNGKSGFFGSKSGAQSGAKTSNFGG